jgi:hypothetical protein
MRKMSIGLLLGLLCLVLLNSFPVLAASNYYVAPTGSNSNPGTEAQPWLTIQKAAGAAAAGDTIYIKAGTYHERVKINVSGSSSGGFITFRNYGNDQVVVDASTIAPTEVNPNVVTIDSQKYIKLSGLEICNNVTNDVNIFNKGVQICGTSHHVELRNCKIHTIQNNNPSTDAGANAIGVYGTNGSTAITNIVIDNCEIYDNHTAYSESISCDGYVDGIEISNNNVHDNNNIGILISGGYDECPNPANDYVRNARIHNNVCIRCSSANNASYKGELCAPGIYSDGGRDSVIERNLVVECDNGIEVESELSGKISTGIIIRDNIAANSPCCGIYIGGSDEDQGWVYDCKVLNNTIYNCGLHSSQGSSAIELAKCHDITIKNNIVYTDYDNGVLLNEMSAQYTYNITMNNNVYYAPGGNSNAKWVWHNSTKKALAAWQSASGQDAGSIFANPMFANITNSDFHLLTGSPAIDFGDPAFVPAGGETDFEGGPRVVNNRVDCGAYEKL